MNSPLPADRSALVLFSGGQDSTVCLAWALDRYATVETIGFDYGQRHRIEMDCRKEVLKNIRSLNSSWAARLGEDHVVNLAVLGQISNTALTQEQEIKFTSEGLPNTFVPGRNLIFLNFAAAVAYRRGLSVIVGGMCETDYSGYPDCRDDTIKAVQLALNLGMERRFTVETPLMWLTKAETWSLAEDLGGSNLVRLIQTDTHTCYLGDRGEQHDWGFGCGTCPACELRATGYREYVTQQQKNSHQGAKQ